MKRKRSIRNDNQGGINYLEKLPVQLLISIVEYLLNWNQSWEFENLTTLNLVNKSFHSAISEKKYLDRIILNEILTTFPCPEEIRLFLIPSENLFHSYNRKIIDFCYLKFSSAVIFNDPNSVLLQNYQTELFNIAKILIQCGKGLSADTAFKMLNGTQIASQQLGRLQNAFSCYVYKNSSVTPLRLFFSLYKNRRSKSKIGGTSYPVEELKKLHYLIFPRDEKNFVAHHRAMLKNSTLQKQLKF
jgi:hypothetical protein